MRVAPVQQEGNMEKVINGKKVKIQCDECNHVWEPTKKMLLEHRNSEDITEIYYTCPKCGKKFHVAYMNSECRALQKLIAKARKEYVN